MSPAWMKFKDCTSYSKQAVITAEKTQQILGYQVAFDKYLEGKTVPETSLSLGVKGISSRGSSDAQGKAWGW